MKITAEVELGDGESKPKGMELVKQAIDPKIEKFNKHFTPKGGPLSSYDREMLRAYTWWLIEVDDG